jgi:hypothetical protein
MYHISEALCATQFLLPETESVAQSLLRASHLIQEAKNEKQSLNLFSVLSENHEYLTLS